MGNVETIERQVRDLSETELTEFRKWFLAFDAERWDRQFGSDVKAGKLDALAEKALKAHEMGKTTPL